MKTKTIKVKDGSITHRGPTNKEQGMLAIGAENIKEDCTERDKEGNVISMDDYTISKRTTDLSMKILIGCVTDHDIKLNGKKLEDYIENDMDGEDANELFKSIIETNKIPEEAKKKRRKRSKQH